jgi:two-component system NarL family sensor kinase
VRPGRDEDDAALDRRRAVAIVRVAALPVIAAGERLVEHPETGGDTFYWLFAATAAYAIAALAAELGDWRVAVPGPVYATADLSLLLALTYFSGGAFSQLRLAFFLLPVGAAFLMSPRGTAAWSAIAVMGYLGISLPHPATRSGQDFEFILGQAVYLAWIGLAAVLLSVVLTRRARRIERLAAARSALLAETIGAEERERKRLAEVLHDEAVQDLLAAGQELDEAERGDRQALLRAHEELRRSVRRLREAIFDLHPYVLEHAGLEAALRSLVERQRQRGGADWSLRVAPAASGVQERLLVSLARELIANAAAHSGAASVAVSVDTAPDGVVLEVADDGRGIDRARARAAVAEGHVGLASCIERAEAAGGRLDLEDRPGGGTVVRVWLPVVGAAVASAPASED